MASLFSSRRIKLLKTDMTRTCLNIDEHSRMLVLSETHASRWVSSCGTGAALNRLLLREVPQALQRAGASADPGFRRENRRLHECLLVDCLSMKAGASCCCVLLAHADG